MNIDPSSEYHSSAHRSVLRNGENNETDDFDVMQGPCVSPSGNHGPCVSSREDHQNRMPAAPIVCSSEMSKQITSSV